MNSKRLLVLALGLFICGPLRADEDAKVAAYVDNVAIQTDQVARELKRSINGRKIADAARPALEAAALDSCCKKDWAFPPFPFLLHTATTHSHFSPSF